MTHYNKKAEAGIIADILIPNGDRPACACSVLSAQRKPTWLGGLIAAPASCLLSLSKVHGNATV